MPVHCSIFSAAVFGSDRTHLFGGDDRLDIGDDNFGIFLGKVGADDDAVPGRQIGLRAVEDLAREAAERQ